MTVYFGLSIETNRKEESESIVNYFKAKLLSQPVYFTKDVENNYWVNVYSDFYTMTDGERKQLTNLLYSTLKQSDLNYRYALVGTEVDEFKTYSELIKDLSCINIPGLVISTKLSECLDLTKWEYFSAGYIWQSYKLFNNEH